MIAELRAGIANLTDGALKELRGDHSGALVTQDAHGRYNEAVSRGNVYQLSAAAGAATAFNGGAGGTPLLSIQNPSGSGKILSLLMVGFASHVAASAAGTVALNLWGGPSAANTGTLTAPTNLLTLAATGSVAKGSSNAATTSSTALGLLLPLDSYYWATAAAAFKAGNLYDIAGSIVCVPGNMIALGASAALTSATFDVAMIWEELNP